MRRILAAVAAAGIALGTASAAYAGPSDGISYTSEAGAHPFEGSASWGADETTVREHDNTLKVNAETDNGWDWISVQFNAPTGQQLHEGTYQNVAASWPDTAQLAVPSFAAYRGTRQNHGTEACAYNASADFTISRLTRGSDGAVTDLDVAFVLRCNAPATRGEAHYHH